MLAACHPSNHSIQQAAPQQKQQRRRRFGAKPQAAAATAAAGAPPCCAAPPGAAAAPPPPPPGLPLGVCASPGAPYRPHLQGPPLPDCDAERVAYVRELDILDAPPAPELDNVLSLMRSMFGVESALIGARVRAGLGFCLRGERGRGPDRAGQPLLASTRAGELRA